MYFDFRYFSPIAISVSLSIIKLQLFNFFIPLQLTLRQGTQCRLLCQRLISGCSSGYLHDSFPLQNNRYLYMKWNNHFLGGGRGINCIISCSKYSFNGSINFLSQWNHFFQKIIQRATILFSSKIMLFKFSFWHLAYTLHTQYFFCFLESKYLLPFLFLTAIFYVCGLLALISRRCKFLSRFIAYLCLIFVTPEFPHILYYFFWLYPWKQPKIMTYIKHVWLGGAGKLNGVKVTWSQKVFFLKRW